MANQWLRLWHEMPNDPKWRTISRVSKQSIPEVISVYLHLLVNASNATERGRTQSVCNEDIASALDLECEQVAAIIAAMQGRVLDGDLITGWKKRQVEREDGSAERSKAWREAKKLEKNGLSSETERKRTQTERKRTPDKDKDKDKDKEHNSNELCGEAPAKNRKEKPLKFDYKTFPLPDCIDREMWNGWMEVRKAKKGAMSEFALSEHLAALLACRDDDIDPNAALVIARKREWIGIEVEWVKNALAQKSPGDRTSQNQGLTKTNNGGNYARKHENDQVFAEKYASLAVVTATNT